MIEERQEQQLRRIEDIRNRVRHQELDPIHKPKSQTDDQFLLSCLKNHFVFYNLSEAELTNVRDHMWWAEIQSGLNVFRQDNPGSCFFVIASGVVQVAVDGEVVKTLKTGDGFGELALLYEIDRPSTVSVRESSGLWVLDKVSFRESVEEIVIKEFQQNQKYLEGLSFYQFLTNRQKEKVASSFVTLKYYKGQNIIQQGDPGSAFYIIKNGTASLIQGNVEERKIYKGESFGVNSLYYNTMRRMTVRADDQVTCQVLGRETLAKIIGPDIYRDAMFRNYVKFTMQKNKELFMLIRKNQERLFQTMKTRYYKTNQVVFKKGSIVHKLIVIIEGKIKKFRSANFLAQAGQTWGQNYLHGGSEIRLEDDIITETESVLIELSLDSLKNVIGEIQVIRRPENRRVLWEKANPKQIGYLGEMQSEGLATMHYLKLGEKKLIGKLYQLVQVHKQNAGELLKNQMQVVENVQHPFLPIFQQILEMNNHVMILSEHISGESLYDVIRDIGLLSTSDAQFYMASMILLLEYLAGEEVVVRDIKPDNFIVDQRGFLSLVSLGSAKSLYKTHKTSTIVGTPHYMAPEVVLGKDYSETVDLWGVGVMLYEFMTGELPFGSLSENPYEIYQEIIQGDVSFPRNFKDRRAKKLIETMLSLNSEARHNGSFNTLKNNTWFENTNWDLLFQKNTETPYKPMKIRPVPAARKELTLEGFMEGLK